jgi:4-hydroxy-tetrahydrodipicolinate synthase
VPYYNRPTQAGIYAHFCAIAQATSLPIILYDVPSRALCRLEDETIVRLVAEMPQIIGLKDASADMTRPRRLRSRLGPGFRLMSGDDATALAFLALGGDGCISVTSNVAPRPCRDMYLSCKRGELGRAQRLDADLARLTTALFREASPAPLKYALSRLGLMSARLRLPLVEPTAQTTGELDAILADLCGLYVEGQVLNSQLSSKRDVLARAS